MVEPGHGGNHAMAQHGDARRDARALHDFCDYALNISAANNGVYARGGDPVEQPQTVQPIKQPPLERPINSVSKMMLFS